MYKKIFIGIVLFITCFAYLSGKGKTDSSSNDNSGDSSSVNFYVKHSLMIHDEPGFEIWIEGWEPLGKIQMDLIDSKSERFTIIPSEDNITTNSSGTIWLEVKYNALNWSPGLCMIIASGPFGIHILETEIPNVLPPSDNNKNWRLEFFNPPTQ